MGNLRFPEIYEAEWSALYYPITEVTQMRSTEVAQALRSVAAEHDSVTPDMLPAQGLVIETREQLLEELQRLKNLDSFVNEAITSGEIVGKALSTEQREALAVVSEALAKNNNEDIESLKGLRRTEAVERWISTVTPENESLMRFVGAYLQLRFQTLHEALETAMLLGGLTEYPEKISSYIQGERSATLEAEKRAGITRAELLNRLIRGDYDIDLVHKFEAFFRETLPLEHENILEASHSYRPLSYQVKFHREFIDAMLDELDMIVIEAEAESL